MMKKSLILLVICASLTACSDRTRVNCERVKNKALSAATIAPNETGTGRCA
jgi:hypothetical protein